MSNSQDKIRPSEQLAIDLREINRQHLKNDPNPVLQGRDSWPNQQFELFSEELALAESLGIKPLATADAGFNALLATNQRFNWAVLLDGSIRVTPSMVLSENGPVRISHAILCYNGGDVLAAGEGRAGDYLSNTTGHYKNVSLVVEPVKRAFALIGVEFKR